MISVTHPPFVRSSATWLAYGMLAYIAYAPGVLGPLMPFLRTELNLSYTMGGLLFSAVALGMFLAGATADQSNLASGRVSGENAAVLETRNL